MQHPRAILWDIYEEHLEEAAFLWGQWQAALVAANCTLSDVAKGPEERLLAHLDGLVLGGGPVAERLLLPALGEDDFCRVSAAAWVLLQAEDADHFESVWEALTTHKERFRRQAISRALELSQRTDLPRLLLQRLPNAEPEIKACIIDATASRGAGVLSQLALRSFDAETHPELLGAVLRAVQRAPELAFVPLVERGLMSDDVQTREAALEAATLLRVPSARAACRRLVAERALDRRLAMAVLALGGDPKDRARLMDWSTAPDLAADALWALAFTGRIDVAEFLLGQLDDIELAPLAADSFCTITGLLIEGPFAVSGTAASLDEPFDAEDPVPEIRPEDELPMPEPARVRAWWHGNRPRFDDTGRYVLGEPWSVQALDVAIARAPTWRRQGWRLGAGAVVPEVAARIYLRQWARRQVA